MNATASTSTPAVAGTISPAPVTRGFANLDCIACGQQGCVTVNLGDVLSFTCTECEGEFDADSVRALIGRWTKALAWLESAPVVEEE